MVDTLSRVFQLSVMVELGEPLVRYQDITWGAHPNQPSSLKSWFFFLQEQLPSTLSHVSHRSHPHIASMHTTLSTIIYIFPLKKVSTWHPSIYKSIHLSMHPSINPSIYAHMERRRGAHRREELGVVWGAAVEGAPVGRGTSVGGEQRRRGAGRWGV